jgi:hypothetical protein
MSERSKLNASHLRRQAFVYVRQSTQAQLVTLNRPTASTRWWSAPPGWGSRASRSS